MKLYRLYLSAKYRGFYHTMKLFIDIMLGNILSKNLTQVSYTKFKSFLRLGYIVNYSRPQSFNEKIFYKKFNTNISGLTDFADKYKVRAILENKNCQTYINDLFMVIEDPEQINLDKLPKSFVMKANHGSGMINIVKDKTKTNENDLKKIVNKWLNTKYNESVGGTEFHYDAIKPKVIFEKLLENKDGSPLLDYKFYCFNGKVEFININDNSTGIPLTYIFDKYWNQLTFALYNKHIKGSFQKPSKLEEMLRIAESLSEEFDYVRIDLYLIDDDKIIFGEYTFFPSGGMLKFVPRKFDYIYGKKLKLSYV